VLKASLVQSEKRGSVGARVITVSNSDKPVQPAMLVSERRSREATALAALQRLDARVEREGQSADKPILKVDFYGTKVTDADLRHLEGLANLRALDLHATSITDAGLVFVKNIASLQTLSLNFTAITDEGLKHLKDMTSLRDLDLGFTKVSDAGLNSLKGMTGLQALRLSLTKVTAAGVKDLGKALPQLRIEN
jgi:hypothetical protein